MSAQDAGFLTLGYAVVIVSFIRMGEKMLQKLGPRKPMTWGSLIVGVAILLLMQTYVMTDTYKILSFIGFSLFGLGLAFYATPSTDAALTSLPPDQAGAGAGIYKMASSLGASFGVAVSATVFTIMNSTDEPIQWIDGLVAFAGRQDNIATREAAAAAFGVNFLMLLVALVTILVTIPNQAPKDQSSS